MTRIYHTSDLHDRRGIVPPLRALRGASPGFLFDCGDSLRGSQTVYHRSEPIVAEIDAAGYDAQAIGNREFHYLYALLRARASRMRHPLICSNLVDTKGRPLPFLDHLRLPTPDGGLYLTGLLVEQYPPRSLWERVFGWRFMDPQASIAAHARRVRPDEMLVVLSHIGLAADGRLATAVPRIDLILGGHSHDTLEQPQTVGDVPIVHAGPYGRFVSRTEMRRSGSRFEIADFALLPLLPA
ncbi:MAG: hypothetical protein NVS1B14_10630 [Vulcanimicrobiaceae bacterium]